MSEQPEPSGLTDEAAFSVCSDPDPSTKVKETKPSHGPGEKGGVEAAIQADLLGEHCNTWRVTLGSVGTPQEIFVTAPPMNPVLLRFTLQWLPDF